MPDTVSILYVLNSASTGGANRSLLVLLARLDRSEYRPLVIVPKEGPLLERLEDLKIPWHILPLSSLGRLRAPPVVKLKAAVRNGRNLLRLIRLIRREQIDLVHTNTIFPLGGAIAARLASVPHVWHLREGLDAPVYDLRFGSYTSRLMASLSDALICISHYVQKVSVPGSARPKSSVIPNALESLPRSREPRISPPLTIGCLGLIGRQKRTRLFVEAAGILARRWSDMRFIVAGRPGSGEEEVLDKCRTRVAELGLEDRFEWLGFVQEPSTVYERLHVLVHPAVYEGFGRVLIEAMSWGLPVVAVDSGASPEIIRNGETGRIVPPESPEALAAAIIHCLEDPVRYSRMSRAAMLDAARRFAPDQHVRRVIEVYERVLAGTKSAMLQDLDN